MQATTQRERNGLGLLQIAIIVLVVITAFVHLQRGMGMLFGGPPAGARPGVAGAGPAGPPPGAGGGFNLMQALPLPLPVLFVLNGLGYLVLGAALYLPALRRFQPTVRWLLIAFTAVTIVMYFLIVGLRPNMVGIVDKLAEVALIGLLLVDMRQPAPLAVPLPS
jgi:hypothetical protein